MGRVVMMVRLTPSLKLRKMLDKARLVIRRFQSLCTYLSSLADEWTYSQLILDLNHLGSSFLEMSQKLSKNKNPVETI